MTTKQIALIQPEDDFGSALKEIEQTEKMCGLLMKTPHYQKMGQEGIFAIVTKAKALNVNLMEALNGGLYFVKGKVGMSSEMMAYLIRQAGHSISKDDKSNNDVCILRGKRADNGDTWTITFSMADAKRAGIAGQMYDKYPSVMLYNRAMSMLARQLFPDVIKGAGYTHDELREIARNKEEPVKFNELKEAIVEFSDQVVPKEEPPEAITGKQYDELYALLEKCSPEFQASINEWLISKKLNSLQQLPAKLFEKFKDNFIKEGEKYSSPLSIIEDAAVEA